MSRWEAKRVLNEVVDLIGTAEYKEFKKPFVLTMIILDDAVCKKSNQYLSRSIQFSIASLNGFLSPRSNWNLGVDFY